MRANLKTLLKVSMLLALTTLVSCSGGGGGGGSSSGGSSSSGSTSGSGGSSGGGAVSTYGSYSSPNILASEFVAALNTNDGTYSSSVQLYTNETLRSKQAGQEQWFVIWDAKFSEYKAVSLNYVRTIQYYDYYSNNKAVASEFRSVERSDVLSGRINGDTYGNDYEVVDYHSTTGYYEGRNSGYLYEDEAGSTDVSLLAKEQEKMKFYEKAARVSFAYSVSIETSMSMVTLGSKIEKMLSHGNGELTSEDQIALMGDLKTLTGVSLEEIAAASQDSKAKSDVLAKIAAKIGTSSQNLEQKFLPEVFGITL
ncbi:MAG: hypothetical protein H7281_05670 [Bacteriovorax sp.]|nr:hypothetical protein [Bacteriovorax sp.]